MIKRCCSPRAVFASAGWGFGKGLEGTGAQMPVKLMLLQIPFNIAASGTGWGAAPSKKLSPESGECCGVAGSRDGAGLLSHELF